MAVVASINTDKKFNNSKEAFEWAVEQLKQSGYKAERQGFGTVIFDEKRIQNGLRYINTQNDYIAFALIPKIIKQGIVVGEHHNHKERGYGTVTFAAPIKINGEKFNMAVVVRQEGKNYYKLHRVLMPEGGFFDYRKRSNAERTAATASVVDTSTDITSKNSILDNDKFVKDEFSDKLRSRSEDGTKYFPKGEEPRRDIDVPSEIGKKKVMRGARTAAEAPGVSEEVAEDIPTEIENGRFFYTPSVNALLMANAQSRVSEDYDEAMADWLKVVGGGRVRDVDIALGEALIIETSKRGDAKKGKFKYANKACTKSGFEVYSL